MAAAAELPSLPHPSNYAAEPGRLFGWGSAKRESAFPGAKTIDAAGHICYPGFQPAHNSIKNQTKLQVKSLQNIYSAR